MAGERFTPPTVGNTAPSRAAAQSAVKIAIAAAETAAAKGNFRAKEELIIAAAMVRAIRPAAEILETAMIAKSRRQEIGVLPVRANDKIGRRRAQLGRGRRARRRGGQTQQGNDGALDHVSIMASESFAVHSLRAAAGRRGKVMVKRDPSPSLLSTSTRPPCSSTAILTR